MIFLLVMFALASCGRQRLSNAEFQQTAEEAEKHSLNITLKQAEIRDILQSYNQTVPSARRISLQIDPDRGLTESSMDKLAAHTSCESDASCRGLLERIFEIQEEIEEYRDIVAELTESLPPAHLVKRGETHYKLSVNYLIHEHKLPRQVADSIVSSAALCSSIMEGFKIWFLYEDGEFSTLVTQGRAHVSPAVFAKVIKKQLMDDARAQGSPVEYENILDSLKTSGALLSNVRQAGTLGM